MAASRRIELFGGADDDPRFAGPTTGDERTVLTAVLSAQRATLVTKCTGLGPELATPSVEPSTLTLIGLVRHLADMERRWFRRGLGGEDAPALFSSDERPDADFDDVSSDPALISEAWDAWHAEVAHADALVAVATDLDLVGHDGWKGEISLRWVLIHMVEEYARHNGHADLLRERIDGAVGL